MFLHLQAMPISYSRFALSVMPTTVSLVYEPIGRMDVDIRWHNTPGTNIYNSQLTEGWPRWCHFCNFKAGDRLTFSAYSNKPDILYITKDN